MSMHAGYGFYFRNNRTALERIPEHRHNQYELVYYRTGHGNTYINGTEYHYSQGNYALIKPDTPHYDKHMAITSTICLRFDYNSQPVDIESRLYQDSPDKKVFHLLEEIRHEIVSRKSFYTAKLDILTQDIIIETLRNHYIDQGSPKTISHIENFLEENYSQNIDFYYLAESLGYSYHRFRHIFKETYGISPHGYMLQLRLKNAAAFLLSTDRSIAWIAQETGFTNESQFSKSFRQHFQCSPREYRMQYKKVGTY